MSELRIYQDTAGEYRWRIVSGNNEIVADSAEGYTRRADAERAARTAALTLAVEARKQDPEFMAHLQRIIEENRDVLDRLAPGDGGDLTDDTEDAA